MNLDQYKWYKRKFFIKINCMLIMLILLAVLLFCFPIISHAEGESPSPSASPSPVPVPSGYTSFGSLFNVQESNIYTMDNTNAADLPSGYINPCSWNDGSFGFNMFDEDLSNGEIIIPDSSLSANIGTIVWSEQAQDFVSGTASLSDFPFYYISRNTQYDTFDIYLTQNLAPQWSMSDSGLIGYRQIDGSSTDYTSYDLGDVYLICTAFYNNDPNVYVMEIAQPQNVRYPTLDHLGALRNVNTGEWEFNVYWGNYGINTLFASNTGAIWTINPAERNGGSTLFYFSDENNNFIESDIIGPPHIMIQHTSSTPETYPDGSGGDDSNNLYMRTADWRFNIPSYWGNVTSSTVQPKYENAWGSGSILFYGLLNDYQNANASNFNLDFKFHIWCSGHYFSDVNSEINGNFYGSFDYSDQVSLTNFINNNNFCSFSVDDIFEFAQNSSGTSFNDFLDSDVKGHNSIDNWNWYITCDACISASVGSSGHIIEKYNFISQVSEETSNSITDNNDPYIPEDGSTPNTDNNQSPSNNDGYSKNGININNNPVITITNTNNNNSSAMSEVNN